MRSEDDRLADVLNAMPVPVLSRVLSERTRALAHANLVPLSARAPTIVLHRLPVHAMSAALLSADAVFAADACIKIGTIFGG
jgi:hypothetical protein